MVDVLSCTDVADGRFDGVIVIADSISSLPPGTDILQRAIQLYTEIDKSRDVAVIACDQLPSKKLIYAPTGPITRDYDDVRRFQDAAILGAKKAVASGCRNPLIVCMSHDRYPLALRVTCLGVLHAVYTPLEIREQVPSRKDKVDGIGVFGADASELELLRALEMGRIVCRDIGGSDPERMAPPKVEEYVTSNFADSCIKINVISDRKTLEEQYPLMAAVDRASKNVARHTARLIGLEYEGEGPIEETLMLVGKGVTYDTGGADLKVGGAMVGMHRDKCGSAFVAGFFQTLSMLRPKGLKVVGAMSMVRNSIGSECYVSDEIITSRAGVRVRICNTDAEGRMAMCDVLCAMKERAGGEVKPSIFTIATLTGHVIRSFGVHYTGVLSNGPALSAKVPLMLSEAGDKSGDPFEISTLRREDYDFHRGKSEYEDLMQSNTKPSTVTNRGHQTPAAFLIMGSGLDKHGRDSDNPLPYSHLDIAGSSGPFPGVPTGAPIVAFTHAFVLNRTHNA